MAVVLGTRPEIVKLAHVIGLLGPAAIVIHTGQHFDEQLSQTFFDAFGLPEPDLVLGVGGASRGEQVGRVLLELDAALRTMSPAALVVQGDTNSAAAGALAANASETMLLHVESGLRSFDRRMPEEHNRVIADHLADLCCAPTETNRSNLLNEGIPDGRITVTGNTVVEALQTLLPPPPDRAQILAHRGLTAGTYVLSTFHRPENVDDPDTLLAILMQLASIGSPVLLPLHPRTRQQISAHPALRDAVKGVVTCDPLGYREFLGLAAECAMLVSDSGGVQEEASILKRPVIVVRRSTERPEVIGTFATLVAPSSGFADIAQGWLKDIARHHAELATIPSPYGDGHASRRTVDALQALLGS